MTNLRFSILPFVLCFISLSSVSSSAPASEAPTAEITAVKLLLKGDYRLRVKVGETWHLFTARLPSGDLSARSFKLKSRSRLEGRLTCDNPACDLSRVKLRLDGQQADLRLRFTRSVVVPAEMLWACETPIYFEEELQALLVGNERVAQDLTRLQRLLSVRVTLAHVKTFSGSSFESARFVLVLQDEPNPVLSDPARKAVLELEPERHALGSAMKYSYALIGAGPDRAVDYLRIRFQLTNPSGGELCYHLPLAPKIFAEKSAGQSRSTE